MNQNAEILYDLINGFLSSCFLPDELQDIPDLFSPDLPCGNELDIIYQKSADLLSEGVSESDLDVIFDGFERIMREIGGKMYSLGTQHMVYPSNPY